MSSGIDLSVRQSFDASNGELPTVETNSPIVVTAKDENGDKFSIRGTVDEVTFGYDTSPDDVIAYTIDINIKPN